MLTLILSIQLILTLYLFRKSLPLNLKMDIIDYKVENNNLFATVQGDSGKYYYVQFLINNNELLYNYCSCKSVCDCNHVKIVKNKFLGNSKEKKIKKERVQSNIQKLLSKKRKISDFKINLEKEFRKPENIKLFKNLKQPDVTESEEKIIDTIFFTKNIENYSNKTNKNKYRLVFGITLKYGIYNLNPYIQKIKKRGGYSEKIISFDEYKLTEPISDYEKILLDELVNFTDYNLSLHIKNIILNKKENIYFNTKTAGYRQISYVEIKKLKLFPTVKPNYNKPNFIIYKIIVNDNYNVKFSNIEFFKSSELLFFIACTDDDEVILFYYFENYYTSNLLTYIADNEFKENELKGLEKVIIEHNESNPNIEISLSKLKKQLSYIYPVPKTILEISYHSKIFIEFFFIYNDTEISASSSNKTKTIETDEEYLIINRNTDYEKQVINYITDNSNYNLTNYYKNTFFIENMSIEDFIIHNAEKFVKENILLRLRGFKNPITNGKGKIKFSVSSGIDWFDIKMDYESEDGEINKIKIIPELFEKNIIQVSKNYVLLTNEDILKMKSMYEKGMNDKGQLKVSKYNFHIINELYDDIKKQNDEVEQIKNLYDKLKSFTKISNKKIPKKFNAKLRNYQIHGYNWLNFLYDYKVNGCLADDMGLGKTIQTLAILMYLKEKKNLGLNLLIAPVSTLPNWESEILQFAPDLKYYVHVGQNRTNDLNELKKYEIIIVSYHTMRNDITLLSEIDFNYIILDESQNIKNVSSQIFKAVKTLKSERRLTLTGTPIENNTLELWAQFDFLNPGLLGTIGKFKKEFAKPIESYNDSKKSSELKKIIFPFILRRKKEDVLKDLPDKTEITLYSEMNENQKKIYDNLKLHYKNEISNTSDEELKKNSIMILTALLKLRQMVLFPELLDKEYEKIESSKFEQLKELLNEILSENHKILLFSQFVEVLNIIKNKFIIPNKINYSYIDGSISVKNRKIQIDNFQKNPDVNLFLLSIKTGGVGINLTAADYVIIFDPWWNPAVEEQAVSRAHRFGQKNKIIAYRMITKNSIEEKILELQKKKKKLVQDIVSTDSGLLKNLKKEDIINLFS